jgi:hypothetical protein
MNASGGTYVAYVFASNAGGFGPTETDNVITCGSVTTDGSGVASVTLGYEPQLVLIKNSQTAGDWIIVDNMRGFSQTSFNFLAPNTSSAEGVQTTDKFYPTATGFYRDGLYASQPHIYIAIRRGPMKVPTSGTSVFAPVAYTGDGSTRTQAVGFPTDLSINKNRAVDNTSIRWTDRLRGNGAWLASTSTGTEGAQGTDGACFDNQTNIILATDRILSGVTYVNYSMRRAPSFFDEVCYTGNATAARNITHNLTVAPEMIIVKARSSANNWPVWATSIDYGSNVYLDLTNSIASGNTDVLNYNEITNTPVPPTSTTFTVGTQARVNGSGTTYVAYVFATAAGVSKVGSYTGTGTTQTINCGFLTGARFVMIKRTDSTGDWYVWDSARGIIPSNDPYLLLNSTAAEVTGTDYVDTSSTGFDISSTAPAAINASGGTFIFLAIA